jgi:hypothetical protein
VRKRCLKAKYYGKHMDSREWKKVRNKEYYKMNFMIYIAQVAVLK